jgi:hypothetical protein
MPPRHSRIGKRIVILPSCTGRIRRQGGARGDKFDAGSFDGNLLNAAVPFAQIGYPRTVMASLVVGF